MEPTQKSYEEKKEENKNPQGLLEAKTMPLLKDKIESKKSKRKIDPNALLVLFGLVLGVVISGSFGIDFFKKEKGKILGEQTNIFEENGKTWVAFSDPIVNVDVVTDKNCDSCKYEDTVKMLKNNLTPTLKINKLEFDSEEGKRIIDSFHIKSIPAFVFDLKIKEIENYEKAKQAFVEKDNRYYLNSAKVGLPTGRYLEILKVDDNDASIGPKDAKVTIIEFSDFQCPYCQRAKITIDKVLDYYKEKIKLSFKHFPLQSHKNASKAAEAAECAKDQGKFWEMHNVMFENQGKLEISDLKKYASDLGLNASEFNNCLDSGKYKGKIENDIKTGSDYGVGGTPAFFINGQFLSGAQPFEEFQKIIDAELAK